jgi:FimV-like protein
MGDKEGARDLLNEVAKEGDEAQKNQAQQMLAKLG